MDRNAQRARALLIACVLGACGSRATIEPGVEPSGRTPDAEHDEAVAPEAEHAPLATECAALPASRPTGVVVRLDRRDAPIGGSPTWLRTTLVARGAPCPTPTPQQLGIDRGLDATRRCRSLDDAALDALWNRLAARHLERIASHTLAGASPHRGGVAISLTWDGGACELADMLEIAIDEGSLDAFRGAVSEIDEAIAHAAPAETTCVAETSPPAFITAYDQAQPGTRHRIEVRWDDRAGEWMPGRLDMPMHHASRFDYVNLDAYAAIDAWHAVPLVLTVTALEVAIVPPVTGDERTWRATYRVRIDSACAVDPPPP